MALIDDILDLIRVKPGKKLRLKDHDPAWAGDNEVPKKDRKAFAKKIFTQDTSAGAQTKIPRCDPWDGCGERVA